MGLFDKKYCDVCGQKIGLLGNRKLEDGNLCKDCANKLSRWFDDRRNSTVDQIKAQLAYREENARKVEAFRATRTFGRSTKVLLDEDKRQFMVVKTNNIKTENPDVLDFSQVTGCDLDVSENQGEEKRRTDDGKYVSYVPPRYYWDYDFTMTIRVNHPFFDDMIFELNGSSVRIESNSMSRGVRGMSVFNPKNHPDYLEYAEMAREIKEALTQMQKETRESIAAANAPKVAVVCTACGATTMPDANGCCEYCGTPVKR